MKFNENLKMLRLRSAFMQKEIASMLNVSVRTFQGWETGRTEPNIEKLIEIADIFGVTIDYLVGRDSTVAHEASFESPSNIFQSIPMRYLS